MSRAQKNLLTLSASIAQHEGVTHWAISMRIFGKGDYFSRLEKGMRPRSDTVEAAEQWFSDHWPDDLVCPDGIPRPPKSKPQEAA